MKSEVELYVPTRDRGSFLCRGQPPSWFEVSCSEDADATFMLPHPDSFRIDVIRLQTKRPLARGELIRWSIIVGSAGEVVAHGKTDYGAAKLLESIELSPSMYARLRLRFDCPTHGTIGVAPSFIGELETPLP